LDQCPTREFPGICVRFSRDRRFRTERAAGDCQSTHCIGDRVTAKNADDLERSREGFGFEHWRSTADPGMAPRFPMQLNRELRDRAAMKELGRRVAYGLVDERRVDDMARAGHSAEEILTALDRTLACF